MSGLLARLDVATDTRDALIQTIRITQGWHHRVTHYRTGTDIAGLPYLILMWSDNSGKGLPLIAPMDNAEGIADQIFAWLKNQDYGAEPDHDGSNSEGWRVTMSGPKISDKWPEYDHSFYDVMCIQPHWIEYHK